ncbi:MAG: hypothetical protein J6C05_09075 [Prevotella sp.]|nr:hypothetical protein [Prevotella sp.]MBO5157261.1 hypothetical protein [Prevotella sp.]
MQTVELNNNAMEILQSVNDNDFVLGYSASGKKAGLVRVGKINSTQWAGCRWRKDSVTTVGEPCGSLAKIERLAELLGLGGYLVQNDHTRRKLSKTNHNQFEGGATAALDGSMGHYQWGWGVNFYYATWEDDTYIYEAIDIKPIPGRRNYFIPVGSRSCAGYATLDRTTGALVSFINYDARYRGGNNDATLDGKFNSQLCKPATSTPIASFATAARKNGNMWLANSRVMFFITGAIKRIIFHNRNIQAGFNATLTADGLHQGGTGQGVALPADWANVWKYYPYINLDAGIDKGDLLGTFSASINDNGTTKSMGGIPSFFGLKNDYKYLYCMCEDVLLNCNADKSQSVYIKNEIDGATFDLTTINGKLLVGRTPAYSAANWSYISKLNLENLVMFPLAVGASETTGYADGYYNPALTSGLRGALCLGTAVVGGNAGSAFLLGYDAPSDAGADRGACLCEFVKAFSTEPALIA